MTAQGASEGEIQAGDRGPLGLPRRTRGARSRQPHARRSARARLPVRAGGAGEVRTGGAPVARPVCHRVCAVAASSADLSGRPRGTPGRQRTGEGGSARASRSAAELALDALRVSLLQFWEGPRPERPLQREAITAETWPGEACQAASVPPQHQPKLRVSAAQASQGLTFHSTRPIGEMSKRRPLTPTRPGALGEGRKVGGEALDRAARVRPRPRPSKLASAVTEAPQ